MSDTKTLPFELTNKSVLEWLSQLNSSDVLLTSNKLYKVLSLLKKQHTSIDTATLGIVVMRLTPVVMYLSGFLEKAIIAHPHERKIAQISIRILRHLAFLHVYLARRVERHHDQVLHANYALQIVAVAFQHSALGNVVPSSVLWECVRECYELAVTEEFLEMPVKDPLAEFEALPTISLAIRRVLLFCVTNPYQFSPQDILSLFNYCTVNAHLVHFVRQGMSLDHVFCWDYTETECYQLVCTRPETLPDTCVLFHLNALLHSEKKTALVIEGADLLIAALNQYRDLVENTKFILAKPYVFVSGFEQVQAFFSKHVRQHKILTLNTPSPNDLNFSSLELVKQRANEDKNKIEVKIEQIASEDIWSYGQDEVEKIKLKFGPMKLVLTPQRLFYVAEVMEAKLGCGDIFVCYDTSLKPVLGITRHVEMKQLGAIQRSVVELCRGQVSILEYTNADDEIITAILQDNKSHHELFLEPGKYTVGNVLKFTTVELVLDRLLELSPKFMRYAVSLKKKGR